jgi:hypothetical protein
MIVSPPHGGLLRGCYSRCATRGGNGFRPVFGGCVACAFANRIAAFADLRGVFERWYAGMRRAIPGCFLAAAAPNSHFPENGIVGLASEIFSRWRKNADLNGARLSRISAICEETGAARGGIARRATREDIGGRAIRRRGGCGFFVAVRKSGRSLTYLTLAPNAWRCRWRFPLFTPRSTASRGAIGVRCLSI